MTDRPTVVPLRSEPPLSDVPGRLRCLAACIEAGELGPYLSVAIVLEPARDAPLEVVGYGRHPSTLELVGLLTAAAQRLARSV